MGVPKNDGTPPENDRGDDVLLDDIEKKSQDTLWHVSLRFIGSYLNHKNIMKNIGSMTFQNFENVDIFRLFKKNQKIRICLKNDKK